MTASPVNSEKRTVTPPNIPGTTNITQTRDTNSSDMTRARLFMSAVCSGDSDVVDTLINEQHAKLVHPSTDATCLHMAAIFCHERILQSLLDFGMYNTDAKDRDGRTASHYAAANTTIDGNDNIYFLLQEAGAKDNICGGLTHQTGWSTSVSQLGGPESGNLEQFTPLDVKQNPSLIDMERVRVSNQYPIMQENEWPHLLINYGEDSLITMILNGELDLAAIPVPENCDVFTKLAMLQAQILGIWDAIDAEDDRTLKHLLCEKYLGLCKDREGRTPLHRAYRRGYQPSIEYLEHICPDAMSVFDKRNKKPADYKNTAPVLVAPFGERRGSRTRILHQSRFHPKEPSPLPVPVPIIIREKSMEMTSPDGISQYVLERMQTMPIRSNDFTVLEELQIEGKADQIWKAMRRFVGNEKMTHHVSEFKKIQTQLNEAIDAIEKKDKKRLKSIVNQDVAMTRDTRGMRLLHIAVLRENHEIAEWIASTYPEAIDLLDQSDRAALHYAAVQPNAIYDTLVDLGANNDILDADGHTAEAYRSSPQLLVRPASAASSLMLRSLSTDDEFYDPDAPTEDQITEWLRTGEVARLEQLVLDGRGHLLKEKTAFGNVGTAEFLKALTQYQSKIDAIHKAVEDGDVRRVKSLIDRPQLATARDTYGMTPLHKALLHGQTNTVRYLLAKYANCVNATDHAGRTPLHYAAADPNGEHMIKVLQKSGGDAFIEDKHGHTPFYYRTHGQRLNVRSMKDNAVMNQLISGQLNRPLLQDLEEDIMDWIHTGNTGKLEELVLTGYADLLLGRNNEFQVEDPESIGFLEVLPQYQAKIQQIHKAVETGNLRAVKVLTERKKLALCRDSRGLSPLHKSIVFDRTDIAKYLIRNYPQTVNAMDQRKRTPLHYAAALRDGAYLYKVMRKSGADPNVYDCNGRNPRYYLKHPGEIDLSAMRLDTRAALKQVLHNRVAPSYLESSIQQWLRDGQLVKLEQLVLSGCGDLLLKKRTASNPDTSAFLDNLPDYLNKIDGIHRSIREGDLEALKSLMINRKLATARDRFGCTPLHASVVHEQTEIVRFIAGHFPTTLNAPDYNKRTAMHYAAAARDGGHYLKILGKAGADPMAVDNEGRTPDYYRRNAVIDLKMIKDRDDDFENMNEEFIEDGVIESPASPASESEGSHIDSARLIDEDDDVDNHRFERLVNNKTDHLPTSENGIYLARTVAPVLAKALAEVLLRRPADPIGFISDWLQRYHAELPKKTNGII